MTQQTVLHQSMLEKPEKAVNIKRSLEFLDYRRSSLSFIAVSTFAFLLMSIFFSMVVIARNSQYEPTDTYATFGILYGPMLFTIVAIVFLILAFTALPMRPQLEEEKAKA